MKRSSLRLALLGSILIAALSGASSAPRILASAAPRIAPLYAVAKKKTVRKKRPSAKAAAAAAAAKAKAYTKVSDQIGEPTATYLEQPAALIPFFELLYRQENRLGRGPVRVLQFGDSHTAAHFWTSTLRDDFQAQFGNAGSGFIHAGKPWKGYRRFDVTSGASARWKSEGLVGRASARGDEYQGLGGVSVHATTAGEWISLEASCANLEIQYLQQPGGGGFRVYDNGELVTEHSTEGELGPGVLQISTVEGSHEFKIVTTSSAPVKLYGWVTEKPMGVTYEPLGISGANASITSRWNLGLFQHFLTRRDPALIVIAYGSNEAGQTAWTYESYYAEFDGFLKKVREASPAAALLVLGPPDRLWYQRRRGWKPAPRMETIIRAQRDAARANRAAYWDTQARMGGEGSMREWVKAGLGARDYVHFSADGYRRLGDVLFRDLMVQYNEFKTFRNEWSASTQNDRTTGIDPTADPEGLQAESNAGHR